MLDLKAIDFTYFHFLSFLFQNLELGLYKILQLCFHALVMITQSCVTMEEHRGFWKNDIIQYV